MVEPGGMLSPPRVSPARTSQSPTAALRHDAGTSTPTGRSSQICCDRPPEPRTRRFGADLGQLVDSTSSIFTYARFFITDWLLVFTKPYSRALDADVRSRNLLVISPGREDHFVTHRHSNGLEGREQEPSWSFDARYFLVIIADLDVSKRVQRRLGHDSFRLRRR